MFKCPHCCTILYSNTVHAPRYLQNHINKFHLDPVENDFTLGSHSALDFKVLALNHPDTLRYELGVFDQ